MQIGSLPCFPAKEEDRVTPLWPNLDAWKEAVARMLTGTDDMMRVLISWYLKMVQIFNLADDIILQIQYF